MSRIPLEAWWPIIALLAWALVEYVPQIQGAGKPFFLGALAAAVSIVMLLGYPSATYAEVFGTAASILAAAWANSAITSNAVTARLKVAQKDPGPKDPGSREPGSREAVEPAEPVE